MNSLVSKKMCPDCIGAPTMHTVEWLSAFFDDFFSYLSWPIEIFWDQVGGMFYRLSYEKLWRGFFLFLVRVHIAQKVDKPDRYVSMRTQVLWEEAARRGIRMYEIRLFGLARDFYIAEYEGQIRTFQGLPRPKGPDSSSLSWMDNKSVMKKKFQAIGIPVARGQACFWESTARKTFREIGGTVIVKPHVGSRSRHTTIHITDEEHLITAFHKAKQLSFLAMVEEELRGFVFRVTLVNKKVAAVMRREPPHVIGDAEHSVRELVAIENRNPLRNGPTFHHIETGEDAEEELVRQGLTWESIPKVGKWVVLNQKVGRGSGAVTSDVTNEVCKENVALFEEIGQVLGDDLVGIDFIIEDMSKPWTEQMPCGVIECNSLPFIDLHYFPYSGQVQPVAAKIWDMIYPESKK